LEFLACNDTSQLNNGPSGYLVDKPNQEPIPVMKFICALQYNKLKFVNQQIKYAST
jgi:hypothetical protein